MGKARLHGGRRQCARPAGLKETCAVLFTKGSLLKDPKKLLQKPGEHTQASRYIKFTSLSEIEKNEAAIKAYFKEAIANEKAGKEVAYMKPEEVELPEELRSALDRDPKFEDAFRALTPGRQRHYAIMIGQAKQAATRISRIEKYRPRILEGKGLND